MNPVGKPVFLFFVFVIAAAQVAAQEWRGLVPLRSTRADVVRLFGHCSDEKPDCEFTIENEDILIVFSKPGDCDVAPDTVVSIQRDLLNATTFAALGLDSRRFKSFDPSLPRGRGYRSFIDEKTGLLVKTYGGAILQINYIAAKKDWKVCPTYYPRPREFVDVVSPHVLVISSVECPETSPVAGEKVVITANYPDMRQRLFFTWETTAGRILEGDNTRKILLDTTGLEGKVTVTVKLNDGNHTASGSCTFNVAPRIKN